MDSAGKCPRKEVEDRDDSILHPRATRSTDERATKRVHAQTKDDFRTEFHRDYTRIIHSRAFRRLRHKTQVFISPENDHLCTRMEHSLHVASVAVTIARALGLNEDLVNAIAAGHDLGHAPFGHRGETALNKIAKKHGLAFSHELHSLRIVDHLESPYPRHEGLNLTFAVRDGIACHYGEGFERELSPDHAKKPRGLLRTRRGKSRPATLEGCVVRWADKVAYLGRDLEDAMTVRVVKRSEIPAVVRKILGMSNRSIIASLVRALVRGGTDREKLAVSQDVHEALNALYDFNMKHIYRAPQMVHHFDRVDRAMKPMFDILLNGFNESWRDLDPWLKGKNGMVWQVFAQFLKQDVRRWRKTGGPQLVIDFIAGMTDSFFTRCFEELFLPRGIV